jgi:cell wall-associated NlpC family hydrolase
MARYRYRRRRENHWLLVLVAVVAVAGVGARHSAALASPPAPAGAAGPIAYAEAQLGKPYVWGATGPDAFDCSGLVMEAYASVGVTIPRTSQEQWAALAHIPPGAQRPGDLVFFAGADGTATAPGHVGLVLSPHRMVEAYATGYPVASAITARLAAGDQAPASSPPNRIGDRACTVIIRLAGGREHRHGHRALVRLVLMRGSSLGRPDGPRRHQRHPRPVARPAAGSR